MMACTRGHSLLLALDDGEEGDGLVVRQVGRVHQPAERAQADTQQQRQVLIPLHNTLIDTQGQHITQPPHTVLACGGGDKKRCCDDS